MATYPPPTENLAIFDDSVFQVNNTPLTPAEGDKRYLRFPNAQGTENMQTTNVNGLLTMNAGGVVADTALTFRDATDDTGIISGVSGSLVLTALDAMTFYTNSSGVYPLLLSTDLITIQSSEVDINGYAQITLTAGVVDLTSSGDMSLTCGNNMVLQALNNTNNAYIEFDTTFIRTINTVEIDLTASGVINLTTASNMTLTVSGDTTINSGNIDLNCGIASTSLTGANLYIENQEISIGVDTTYNILAGNVSCTTTITGSTITLDAPEDEVLLATEPSGTVDLAVATVGYVNTSIGQGTPVATVIMWAGAWANLPTGFMLCNGQSVSQATYSALYAVVGNYYGTATAGNFLLPNLVNTFPIGSTSGGTTTYPYSTILGSALSNGGSSTISVYQMPAHTHGILGNNTGTGGGSSVVINPSGSVGTPTQSAGGGQAYAQPFQALQFLIKY